MKKSFFILFTAILMSLIFAGCSNKTEQNTTTGHQHKKQTRNNHQHEDVMIGQTKKHGMDIHAVYLPHAVNVAPIDRGGQKGNIHLEADIHATKDNSFGFHKGEWIPYLTIDYTIQNIDTNQNVAEGQLYPMVAGDPHYASNIAMPGPGNYKLTYTISPPDISRHSDDVKDFYKPFTLDWKFKYEVANK